MREKLIVSIKNKLMKKGDKLLTIIKRYKKLKDVEDLNSSELTFKSLKEVSEFEKASD